MSIYDFNLKGMRKAFKDFNKTLYGKTIFLIAYIIPAVLLIAGVTLTVLYFVYNDSTLLAYGITFIVTFTAMFLLANAYYYAEVRHFCDKKKISMSSTKKSTKKSAAKKSSKRK